MKTQIILLLLLATCLACHKKDKTGPDTGALSLTAALVGAYSLDLQDANANKNAPTDSIIKVEFSAPIDTSSARKAISLATDQGIMVPTSFAFQAQNNTVLLRQFKKSDEGQSMKISINSSLKGAAKETFSGATLSFTTAITPLVLDSLVFNSKRILPNNSIKSAPLAPASFSLYFNKALLVSTATQSNISFLGAIALPIQTNLSPDGKLLQISTTAPLPSLRRYTLRISKSLAGAKGEKFDGLEQTIVSKLDTTDKFPRIPDGELLTLVQKQTFKYFYDAADAASGLAQERNASPDVVTLGGSGFGVMALIVGVDRGFITRQQAVQRWDKITKFLARADRFHGIWPHWLRGSTGRVIPFSTNDDGGDLVESSFMAQGLVTVRQFLSSSTPSENPIIGRIDSLLNGMEWDWYRRGGQDVLYWHWSPRVAWQMNFPLRGWNETMITYVMAAASTTHGIPRSVYTNGYCSSENYRNGRSYYGITLPLGPDGGKGGPLFFTHYSFLGLNPTNLRDANAQYFLQNQAHSQINYQYCVQNPRRWPLYGPDCWGLTASDNEGGYSAHDPDNDLGVISPTAALSSMPYTPAESMRALRFFYYKMGDRLWGPQGFYDAFNPGGGWVGNTYLAIDQGPIIIMIENYRTQRLWNLFMSNPQVQQGLITLGFTY